jgi:hypothetical protein
MGDGSERAGIVVGGGLVDDWLYCRCSVSGFSLPFVRFYTLLRICSPQSRFRQECVTDEICENEIRVCFRVFCAFSLASQLFFFCVTDPGALYGLHREVFVSSLSCRLISQGPVHSAPCPIDSMDRWS